MRSNEDPAQPKINKLIENEEVLVRPSCKGLLITAPLMSQEDNQVQVHQEHKVLRTDALWFKGTLTGRWLRGSPQRGLRGETNNFPERSSSQGAGSPGRDSVTQSAWVGTTAVLGTRKILLGTRLGQEWRDLQLQENAAHRLTNLSTTIASPTWKLSTSLVAPGHPPEGQGL